MLWVCLLMLILGPAVASPGNVGSQENTVTVVADAGARILRDAGITQPTDIEFAVVNFDGGGTYRVDWATDRELIVRLYQGLRCITAIPDIKGPIASSQLVLGLRGGRIVWFAFSEDPLARPGEHKPVFLPEVYLSPCLSSVLQDIKRSGAAFARGSRVGEFEVASVEAQPPSCRASPVPLDSPDGHILLKDAVALVDSLDLRGAHARVATTKDIEARLEESGGLQMTLSNPITVTIAVFQPVLLGEPRPFSRGISYEKVIVDRISVFGDNNAKLQHVAFGERYLDRYYVSGSYLTRREEERKGVEEYGFAGHPLEDKEY